MKNYFDELRELQITDLFNIEKDFNQKFMTAFAKMKYEKVPSHEVYFKKVKGEQSLIYRIAVLNQKQNLNEQFGIFTLYTLSIN